MARLWKTLRKSMRKSLRKSCAEKSGKNLYTKFGVDKNSYTRSFTKIYTRICTGKPPLINGGFPRFPQGLLLLLLIK